MSNTKLWKALKKEYTRGRVGGRPYFCKICGADGFLNKKVLHHHLWTHFVEQKSDKNLIDLMAGLAVEGRSEDEDLLSKKMESLKLRQRQKFEKKKKRHSSKSKKTRSRASASGDPETLATPAEARSKKCAYPGCEVMFNDKKMLRRHFLGHGGPKFGCDFCSKKFTRKDNKSRHVKGHGQAQATVQELPEKLINFFDDYDVFG